MGSTRNDVENTKKYAKKFVRYQEGAEKYIITLPMKSSANITMPLSGKI